MSLRKSEPAESGPRVYGSLRGGCLRTRDKPVLGIPVLTGVCVFHEPGFPERVRSGSFLRSVSSGYLRLD